MNHDGPALLLAIMLAVEALEIEFVIEGLAYDIFVGQVVGVVEMETFDVVKI